MSGGLEIRELGYRHVSRHVDTKYGDAIFTCKCLPKCTHQITDSQHSRRINVSLCSLAVSDRV